MPPGEEQPTSRSAARRRSSPSSVSSRKSCHSSRTSTRIRARMDSSSAFLSFLTTASRMSSTASSRPGPLLPKPSGSQANCSMSSRYFSKTHRLFKFSSVFPVGTNLIRRIFLPTWLSQPRAVARDLRGILRQCLSTRVSLGASEHGTHTPAPAAPCHRLRPDMTARILAAPAVSQIAPDQPTRS